MIVKHPRNSHISHKFNDLKIMPISMLFKLRLVIFYNRHVLPIKDNYNLTEKDHQMVTRKNLKNPIKTIKIKSKKEKRSMLFTAANLYGELRTFGTSPVGCSGNSWRLACGSWMLGTANCMNGAVITLVSNYLIGPFVFVFSLNDLSEFLSFYLEKQ